ncbi:MAG: hypothetical protein B7Z73_13665 [Planctomycetia bacterium 21-64-5]|nr:MAG: hypothetical protein B7Z73_13665 [Planctomycetia bacterium 21-64-5]HQU45758.1 hypothetical protein [Pirellulales bacterium]
MSLPQNKQRTAGLVGLVLVSCLASGPLSQVGAADNRPVLRTVAERRPALTDSSSPQSKPSGHIERLLSKIHRVTNHYYQRTLTTQDQNCWEVMHWIIAYGVKSHILRGGSDGLPVNSIGWLCYGGRCAGQPLVYLDQGRITASKGPHVQGHQGQFLAILAQAKVMKDYPVRVGNQSFTVADLIETEKLGCQSGMELTFKLIALAIIWT